MVKNGEKGKKSEYKGLKTTKKALNPIVGELKSSNRAPLTLGAVPNSSTGGRNIKNHQKGIKPSVGELKRVKQGATNFGCSTKLVHRRAHFERAPGIQGSPAPEGIRLAQPWAGPV